MNSSRFNLLFIFLSFLMIAIAFMFRVETLFSAILTVLLFWLLYGMGKLLARKRPNSTQIAIPIVSLLMVIGIGKVINYYLGVPVMLNTGIQDVIQVRTLSQIEDLANSCQIRGYVETHSNSYTILLKDGSRVYLPTFFQTKDKSLSGLMQANKAKCGETFWGIE